jgi:hypothetical protein
VPGNGGTEVGEQAFGVGQPSADHNEIQVQQALHRREHLAEGPDYRRPNGKGVLVATGRQRGDSSCSERWAWHSLAVAPSQGRGRRQGLQATSPTATANGAAGFYDQMAELTGQAPRAGSNLAP